MFTTGFWTANPAELAAFAAATWQTETEIPLSDVPDDPSEGTLPEDAPLTDDPEPGQAGGVLVPEAEPEGPIADANGDELEHGEPDHPETDPESETQSGEPA